MVLSPCANYFIMSLIILNAALLGIEIDMSAKVDVSADPLFGSLPSSSCGLCEVFLFCFRV